MSYIEKEAHKDMFFHLVKAAKSFEDEGCSLDAEDMALLWADSRIAELEAREQWVSVEGGDLPPYGEPVLLKIKGVVQHNLYMRDAADDTPDWWECTVDQGTTKWVESTDEWMPLPTPPTEGEG